MNVRIGSRLKYKNNDYMIDVIGETDTTFTCVNALGDEHVYGKSHIYNDFALLDDEPSALDTQHGGDHYKKLGNYQPWQVCQAWLTEEEFRGYMKGTAIAYLAREKDKGGDLDIDKAIHTLQALREMTK